MKLYCEIIDHNQNPKELLEEAYRVIRKGRILVISPPSRLTVVYVVDTYIHECYVVELNRFICKFIYDIHVQIKSCAPATYAELYNLIHSIFFHRCGAKLFSIYSQSFMGKIALELQNFLYIPVPKNNIKKIDNEIKYGCEVFSQELYNSAKFGKNKQEVINYL
jgi:SAM-dependent methyltransferase